MKKVLFSITLCVTANIALSQDTTFVPYAQFDQSTGNYIIYYDRDTVTSNLYQTLFVPLTKIKPSLTSSVGKEDEKYIFSYAVSNNAGAYQKIMSFDMEMKTTPDTVELPQHWLYFPHQYEPFIFVLHDFQSEHLDVGDSLTFDIVSSGLPCIIDSRFQGDSDTLSLVFENESPESVESVIDSLMSIPSLRYVPLMTIGPTAPPTQFDSVAFVDTLLSYTTQSRTLEWITSQGAADKYIGYFDSVKYYLQQSDVTSALAVLEQVLTDAETDNGSTLTSEAYALIRFNTEYLIERLEE